MTEQRSVLTAFIGTVPAALVLWIAALYLHTHVAVGPAMAAARVPYMIAGGVLFGIPIVIGVVVVIALPTALILKRTIGLSRIAAIAAGVACGIAVRWAVVVLLGEPEASFVPWVVVVITGAGSGVVWWHLWSRPPLTPRAPRGAI